MARTVQTPDGVELHVVELGPEGAPPVLVLHGGPAAHHDYLLPGFATLADTFRVVLYDQRGGGRSVAARDADLGWERHVEDVSTVIDALGLGRPHVAGYSFGGLFAMLHAARQPTRVDRLALCSTLPGFGGFRPAYEARLTAAQARPDVVAARDALERSGLRETQPEEYRRRRFALSIAGYVRDLRHAYGVTPFKVNARAADLVRASLGEFDFRGDLGAIDGARTLVVHGEDDPLDVTHARDLATRLGARFAPLPACGHVPYVEAPEPFFDMLRGFFGGSP